MKWFVLFFLLAGSILLVAQESVPSGTLLPVTLNSSFESGHAKPGDIITGTIAQDVPLPSGQSIRRGSKLIGRVVSLSAGSPVRATLAFDSLMMNGKRVPVDTNVRAIASFMMIQDAQVPTMGPDKGTPASAWTTVQIGGDVVYRGGGPVMNANEVVGKPVPNGVLGKVRPALGENCRGAIDGNNAPQALWLFSSDACGVYGMSDLSIVHAGRTDPTGQFILASQKGSLKIPRGTGMLLRVNGSDGPAASAR
jgi:hypothetical protein